MKRGSGGRRSVEVRGTRLLLCMKTEVKKERVQGGRVCERREAGEGRIKSVGGGV